MAIKATRRQGGSVEFSLDDDRTLYASVWLTPGHERVYHGKAAEAIAEEDCRLSLPRLYARLEKQEATGKV